MAKFVDALQQSRHENQRLTWLCLLLGVLAALAMWGWKTAPRDLTAHIPPDLRNGATINVGPSPDVPDTTVYTFAFYIWQQVNRWKTDGAKDYGDQIFALQSFLTPTCREQLIADMNQRSSAGELARRTRAVMEIPGLGYAAERVSILGGNVWKVLLDTQVQETQGNVSVKDAYIRYPLRVVRFDVDREKNPWQLAIDCFGGERPARLDAKSVSVSQAGRTLADVRVDSTAAGARSTSALGSEATITAASITTPPTTPPITPALANALIAATPTSAGTRAVPLADATAPTPPGTISPATLPRPTN